MDCKHVNEHLIDYLYQELESDQMDQIDSHLQSCQGCSEELSTFESTRQLMRELPELDPSPQVTDRLVREAARAVQPEGPGFWERVRAGLRVMVMHPAMTAAVVLVVVVGISFYAFRQSSPPTGRPEADNLPPVPPAGAAKIEPSIAGEATVERPETLSSGQAAKEAKQVELAQPAVTEEPAGQTAQTFKGDELAPKTPAPTRRARALRRVAARPRPKRRPRLRSRKGPGRYDTPSLAPSAKRPSKADFGDLNRNEDDSGGLALEGEERKEKGTAGRKQQVAKPRSKPKPPAAAPAAAREHSAQHWLARAEEAMKAGKCDQALYAYNRALQLRPGLKKKVGLMVNRCVAVLARGGEARLRKAKKQYPRLAGFIEAEISRARQKRAKESNPPAQQEQKKAAPPSSVGY